MSKQQNIEEQTQRSFQFGQNDINQESHFCRNFITTSKYSLINFFPKCLLLQFKRYANIYFLIIAILQSIKEISPLHPFAAWTPLIFVIALSMVREAIEDLQRHKSDVELNSSQCKVFNFQTGKFEIKLWSEVQVGDYVKVVQNETFPTDIIVIKSSTEDGVCFIETSSLDGEKNLKPKGAMTETLNWSSDTKPSQQGKVICIPPDQDLYKFEGTLEIPNQKVMVNAKQFLLRGSKLKNTNWIIGIVVYTGSDTKIMKNADKSKFKQSNIENVVNKLILMILLFQILVSLTSAIGFGIWHSSNEDSHDYIQFEDDSTVYAILTFFTYIVLNNTMIPISLIVSLEIVKAIQGYLIQVDEEMYCESKQRGPKVFTTSINEELGQIEYIFSDKTGTLTCNIMEFKLLMVGADLFGDFDILGDTGIVQFEKEKRERIMPKKSKNKSFERRPTKMMDNHSEIAVSNLDKYLIQLLNVDEQQEKDILKKEFQTFDIKNNDQSKVLYSFSNRKQLAQEILLLLSTCHECVVEQNDEEEGQQQIEPSGNIVQNVIKQEIRYQGPSPDEVTLVDIARQFGYVFTKQTTDKIFLELWKSPDSKIDDLNVELLMLFPFDSDRKRMSVIIRHQGKIKLYIKGADNMIIERLNKKESCRHKESILEYIDQFSKKGLRTLLLAMKVIEEDEYKEYYRQYQKLSEAKDKEKGMSELGEKIEQNLTLLGATAVEDKLQENVPETIRDLLLAKIKVWMLTGDKMETAENIARSCKLIQSDFNVMSFLPKLNEKKEASVDTVAEELQKKVTEVEKLLSEQDNISKALLIEGQYLAIVLSKPELQDQLIKIIQNCQAVVCCRATPKQKAQVVRLVKEKLNKITLAIGDGANDVNMIQEAHIGIGLYGQEGMRAVQSSDYALPEFQQLWRLVLVHGRWSYIRISEMILYFFYKNFIFTIPQFYFSFSCAFSGQTIFDDWYITLYNIVFTALPLIIRAVTEQDVYFRSPVQNDKKQQPNESDEELPKQLTQQKQNSQNCKNHFKDDKFVKQLYPKLYYVGQQNTIFNLKNFFQWMFQGMVHAGLVYFIHIMVIHKDQAMDNNGYSPDIWFLSISMYTSIIFIVSIKLMIHTQFWTVVTIITMIFTSILSYIIYIFIASQIEDFFVYMTSKRIVYSPDFYLTVSLCVGVVFAFDCIVLYYNTFEKAKMVEYLKYVIKNGKQHRKKFMKAFRTEKFDKKAVDVSFGSHSEKEDKYKTSEKQQPDLNEKKINVN